MAWSTRQLADLAGTTVKTVRHYHQVGLLEEPERSANGYKQYGVTHLVRLLRVKRLADLGVPLAEVAAFDGQGPHPTDTLRELDAELAATVARLQGVRAELALILRDRSPVDVPDGFAEVSRFLSDADRAMVLVYSRILSPQELTGLHEMLRDFRPSLVDGEFETLPADAPEDVRADLAERLAPQFRHVVTDRRWVDPEVVRRRSSATRETLDAAILALYNPAQVDVVRRTSQILRPVLEELFGDRPGATGPG